MRQKEFGIWQSLQLDAKSAQIAREIGMGLMALGFAPGECASVLVQHQPRMAAAPTWASSAAAACPTASIRPTRRRRSNICARTRAPSCCSSRTTSSSTRRSRCARGCRGCARSSCSTWKACASLHDPQVISLDALRALGREYDARSIPAQWERRVAARQPDRPRGAGLHLRHHRQAEGRDASPREPGRRDARLQPTLFAQDERTTSACASCRCATSPSAWSASTSRSYTGSVLNFVENPETVPENVREIAPTVFGAVPRIWEKFYSVVTDRAARGQPACSRRAYRWRDRRRHRVADLRAGRASRCRRVFAATFWLARVLVLDNIRKLIGMHRARLLVTGAAPISPDLVRWYLALGRADARGLGHDRVRRRRRPPRRRRASSRGRSARRCRDNEVQRRPRDGRDPGARHQRCSWAT